MNMNILFFDGLCNSYMSYVIYTNVLTLVISYYTDWII